MIKDHEQRQQATDPTQSFIVQAPAGSGKTELLTQRYLRLLANVQAPEQIIALTFTRKAANEMRERILAALQKAERKDKPTSTHQATTQNYATKALHQDHHLGWQILNQPSRLRVVTIDSLCQRLVQAKPLQPHSLSFNAITDKPQRHYVNAAQNCLSFASQQAPFQASIATLLYHLDNQPQRLITLFCSLLASRDQWLSALLVAKQQNREIFEQAIAWIEKHELGRLFESISALDAQDLVTLIQQLASLDAAPEPIQHAFHDWQLFNTLSRETAAILADTLFTSQGTLRKSLDWRVGVSKKTCPGPLYQSLKETSQSLFETLAENQGFIDALLRVAKLPNPEYDQHQWDVLQALFNLLPILAAHLELEFKANNQVDFSAISQQALQALGDEDNPTDLTLYLDHQIHHLLVDEFQDTSIQQYELLSKLVDAWQPDDGKTLFVVGDPMQSIYRFRSAEVGLFLRAQQQGMGPVGLVPLELTCNFRSTANIVNWVNQQFSCIFPRQDDIESGAVTFHSSDWIQPESDVSCITSQHYQQKSEEANAIIALIQHEQALYPDDDIAILVRSRNDLQSVMSQLRCEGIPFQGVDVDPLANLPHIMDVWSLTQALLLPANRLVWLAFLRSPWCGLNLQDIYALADYEPNHPILNALSNHEQIKSLSQEGHTRVAFIQKVLNHALNNRYQQSLVNWVLSTLNALHADHILADVEQADLEQFWRLLDEFDTQGQLSHWQLFQQELKKLYSKRVNPAKLQIMTIHKSKGLEFDSVILPGLSTASRQTDKPLLRWLKLPTIEKDLLLVSPIKAAHQDQCLLFNHLEQIDLEKAHYETQRLLYVAATRAKKRLHLFDHKEKGPKGSFRQLLNMVSFDNQSVDSEKKEENSNKLPKLFHLPVEHYNQPPEFEKQVNSRFEIDASINHTRLTGIATHELLQWMGNNHPKHLNDIPWSIALNGLRQQGLNEEELKLYESALKKHLQYMLDDKIGAWILKEHQDERNEYELLVKVNGETKTRIIDRTFIENQTRWIIDYKTGQDDEKAIEKHKAQLNEYANIFSKLAPYPTRCCLYYITTGLWVDWDYL
jgi:ATP-dependent helicase/nuclease subunit A